MIKCKMAPNPNPNQRDQSGGSKTKRQKLKQPSASKKQQAPRKQQAPTTTAGEPAGQSRNLGLGQSEDSAWIYGMISNMQLLLQKDQRLKQAVRRQQLMGAASSGGGHSNHVGGPQLGRHAAKSSAPRSRPSNSSSGYSTPSSLYSAASLSPPFSSSSALVHCAYASSSSSNSPNSVMTQQSQSSCSSSSSSSSPPSKHLKSAAPEMTKQQKSSSGTNKSNNQLQKQQQQQQQILPRSPISRQIKFHEYKGPPQARHPSNQQKQHQQRLQQQQQQRQQAPPGDSSFLPAAAFNVDQFGGAHQQIQRMQANGNQLQTQPPAQPTTSLAPMTSHQIHCGRLATAGQPVESLERRVVKAIKVAPGGYALASGGNNQPRQVSLQLIRSADGQSQQVLVLDPVAFEQMQQPQHDYSQQRGSIIVLQHAEPMAPTGNYSTLLMDNNNDTSDDNTQFQAQQPAGMTTGRSFNVSESSQMRANFRAQLQRIEQQQQQQVFPSEELYYRPQQQQQQQQAQQPQAQHRVAGFRPQTYEHQFDAGCQMGPNPLQQQQQQHQAPLDNYQLASQQHLEQMSPAAGGQQPSDQNQLAQFYQGGQEVAAPAEAAYASGNGFSQGLELEETLEDDTCEIEPTISFDGDLEHGMMMYSEFIDSQDIPLNVDESDWLKKFLPPCSSS